MSGKPPSLTLLNLMKIIGTCRVWLEPRSLCSPESLMHTPGPNLQRLQLSNPGVASTDICGFRRLTGDKEAQAAWRNVRWSAVTHKRGSFSIYRLQLLSPPQLAAPPAAGICGLREAGVESKEGPARCMLATVMARAVVLIEPL